MFKLCLLHPLCLIAVLLLTGCGGAPDPVNLDKDRPEHAKKEKEKEKEK